MIIAGVDTSLPLLSVALLRDDALIGALALEGKGSRNEKLLPSIDWLLAESGVGREAIDLARVAELGTEQGNPGNRHAIRAMQEHGSRTFVGFGTGDSAVRAHGGRVLVDGRPTGFTAPADAQRAGVAVGGLLVGHRRAAAAADLAALAAAGLARRIGRGQWDFVPILLILAASLMVPVSSYGGEVLLRTYPELDIDGALTAMSHGLYGQTPVDGYEAPASMREALHHYVQSIEAAA